VEWLQSELCIEQEGLSVEEKSEVESEVELAVELLAVIPLAVAQNVDVQDKK
jgi:hypothetical protein